MCRDNYWSETFDVAVKRGWWHTAGFLRCFGCCKEGHHRNTNNTNSRLTIEQSRIDCETRKHGDGFERFADVSFSAETSCVSIDLVSVDGVFFNFCRNNRKSLKLNDHLMVTSSEASPCATIEQMIGDEWGPEDLEPNPKSTKNEDIELLHYARPATENQPTASNGDYPEQQQSADENQELQKAKLAHGTLPDAANDLSEKVAIDTQTTAIRVSLSNNRAIESTAHPPTQSIDISKTESQQVPILMNGFTGGGLQTYKTCAFDCIFSTVACLHRDYSKFRAVINTAKVNHKSQFCAFIAEVVEQKKVPMSAYIVRNKMLHNLYGFPENVNRMTSLDCETGFGGLFSKVCTENEVLASSIMNRSCETCKSSKKIVRPFLPLLHKQLDITDLQCAIIQPAMEEECPKCHQLCHPEHSIGPLLALEVEQISPQARQRHSVDVITSRIEVGKDMFNLCGVIENKQEPRHFICHMLRKSGHWETHDDLATSVTSLNISKEINIAMLYYIRSGKL